MSASLSTSDLDNHLARAKAELADAEAQLAASQRLCARAWIDNEHVGHRADAGDVTRQKIRRLRDIVGGLGQLRASAEHTEVVQQLDKLRHKEAQKSRAVRDLHAESEKEMPPVSGTGTAYRDALRVKAEQRQAARSRYEFAVQQLRNLEQEIAQLEARERALASDFGDAIEPTAA